MMLIPYEPFHDGYDALRRAVKREQIAYEGRNKLAGPRSTITDGPPPNDRTKPPSKPFDIRSRPPPTVSSWLSLPSHLGCRSTAGNRPRRLAISCSASRARFRSWDQPSRCARSADGRHMSFMVGIRSSLSIRSTSASSTSKGLLGSHQVSLSGRQAVLLRGPVLRRGRRRGGCRRRPS